MREDKDEVISFHLKFYSHENNDGRIILFITLEILSSLLHYIYNLNNIYNLKSGKSTYYFDLETYPVFHVQSRSRIYSFSLYVECAI